MRLKGRHLLTGAELSSDEIYYVLSRAMELKRQQRMGIPHCELEGKTVALIFEKPSTRTRVSFEAGIVQLGAHPIFLSRDELQLSRGESVEDTGRTLSRYVDAIVIRANSQGDVESLAASATVPVINGLTDDFHPCQALADLMTILEKMDRLAGVKIAYVGDANNVAHSLLIAGIRVGANLAMACPRGYQPKESVVDMALEEVRAVTHRVTITDDPAVAVEGADVVYTDVWVSMGQEAERAERLRLFRPYQVNESLLGHAKPDVILMHCLPAHRGEEVTDAVIEGPHSVVFDQAENRLHAQKAVLALLVGRS